QYQVARGQGPLERRLAVQGALDRFARIHVRRRLDRLDPEQTLRHWRFPWRMDLARCARTKGYRRDLTGRRCVAQHSPPHGRECGAWTGEGMRWTWTHGRGRSEE